MKKRVVLGSVVALAGLAGAGWWANSFSRDVIASMTGASGGEITEFAYAPDLADFDATRPVSVLGKRHLAGESWQGLVRSFGSRWSVVPRGLESQLACLFEPHHRIDWQDAGGHQHTLFLCFRCGEVRWNAREKRSFWNQEELRAVLTAVQLPLRSDSDYDQP